MSRESLLARAQAFAEQGMVDTCTIRRPAGQTSDELSGTTVMTYLNPDPYAGSCRFRQGKAQGREEVVGEDHLVLLRQELQLPLRVTGLQVGDEVTCNSSRDPDLAGRQFVIRDLMHQTDSTSRRVQITERTG
jgi:hypothetical protein